MIDKLRQLYEKKKRDVNPPEYLKTLERLLELEDREISGN